MSDVEILRCDVAVIGGGIAGMVTATRAAQGGAHVLVFERSAEDRYLCNSRLTAGIFHCALNSVTTPPADLARYINDATGGTAEPAQANAVASDALRAVRWLQEQGLRFVRGAQAYHDFTLAPPTVNPQNRGWEGRGGDVLLRTLETALAKTGGQVMRGMSAKKLRMDDSRCTGVDGENAAGGRFCVEAAATVVADGGFQTSSSLLAEAITPDPDKVFQRNARTGFGDGLRMAREAGAALTELRGFYGHILSADAFSNEKLWPHLWLDFVAGAGILVDRSGQRFTDEGHGGVSMANAIAAQPDPLGTFAIADQKIWDERGTINMQAPNPRLREYGGTVHVADSLSALAKLAGINEEALQDSVARYNEAVLSGRPETLSPPRSTSKFEAYRIDTAPYYALPACAGVTYTMGGILIDDQARVLDKQRQPIAGLYAAGATTGGLEGGPVGSAVGYVGGLIKSSVMGLRAADDINKVRSGMMDRVAP
jgi:fumarate reductase flavoprotein subunit